MSYKVFVRFQLWAGDLTTGYVNPCGARLFTGDDPVKWPRECLEKDGKTLAFVFNQADEAIDAAKALESYLNRKKKTLTNPSD